jgi:quercetin dioxygenase-like cupin family protein
MPFYDWSQIEKEQVGPQATRQVVHAEKVTIARIHLHPGAVVAEHSHENEQVTVLLTGRVKLTCPGRVEIVEAGQLIQMPPNVPHRLDALEETTAIDVFVPRRDDWMGNGHS